MAENIIFAIIYFSGPLFYIIIGILLIKMGRGYNSLSRAMASMEAQNFASRYFGRKSIQMSLIFAVPSIILGILTLILHENEALLSVVFWVWIVLFTLLPIIGIVLTELKLRKYFDKNGKAYR